MAVRIGTKFHSVIADANAEWKVTAKLGRGVWEATCIDEDYGGSTQAFRTGDIKASQAIDKMFADNRRSHEGFYADLTVGETIHYFNGFTEFVRCKVVEEGGENRLMPVALVGDWTHHSEYHRKKIERRESFTPNVSCIYEAPSYARKSGPDPREMEPVEFLGQLSLAGVG